MASEPVPGPSLFTEVDYATFGNIIHSFAKFEHALIGALAHVSGLPIVKLLVITQELQYAARLNTLYSFMELYNTDASLKSELKGFFDEVHKYNGLRNFIAHSIWTTGVREHSVKPMTIRIRGRQGKLIGVTDDGTEKDYTSGELIDISNRLALLHNSYVRFAVERGIFSFMDENIADNTAANPSGVGGQSK